MVGASVFGVLPVHLAYALMMHVVLACMAAFPTHGIATLIVHRQYVRVAAHADRLLVLEKGRAVLSGPVLSRHFYSFFVQQLIGCCSVCAVPVRWLFNLFRC